jgi:hypothetical protein
VTNVTYFCSLLIPRTFLIGSMDQNCELFLISTSRANVASLGPTNLLPQISKSYLLVPAVILPWGYSGQHMPFELTFFGKRAVKHTTKRNMSSLLHTKTTSACQQKMRVNFSRNVAITPTITRKELRPEEVRAAWYSAEEYSSIKDACLKQVNKIDQGKTLKDKKYCARGLEGHTRLGRITRSQNRSLSIDVVLDEQAILQIDEGFVGEMTLAQVYQNTTSSCQVSAIAMGLLDQHVAEKLTCDKVGFTPSPQNRVLTARSA